MESVPPCAESCLLLDFDGTLAEIVEDPQHAQVVDGGIPVLRRLANVLGMVGIVSGRPLNFLENRFPQVLHPHLAIAGSYGAEMVRRGFEERREEAGNVDTERLEVVRAELATLSQFGVDVEFKPVSVTLHFRRHPEVEGLVHAEVERLRREFGVFAVQAKCAVEVFVSLPPSKGSVVLQWAHGWKRVIYLGDDLSDLEAFDALSELEDRGARVQRIAVVANDLPSILRERSDLTLESPVEVIHWLASLERQCSTEISD